MPSKSTQDSFDFLQKYERYVAACGYAKEWASTIAALAQDLQNHSQFLSLWMFLKELMYKITSQKQLLFRLKWLEVLGQSLFQLFQ